VTTVKSVAGSPDIVIDEGGGHRPIGTDPIRVCCDGGQAVIHYLSDSKGGADE
jgi:hypothetical protein